jgi:RNA polymerase sigma-70 factor (ECF subfamily)
MSPSNGDPVGEQRFPIIRTRDASEDYRRLLAVLVSRARWLGSRDPEAAAQEALKRSLENASSQPAVEYYFSQDLPAGLEPPEWPLDKLLAWLHGALYYVVQEERHRASSQREVSVGESASAGWDGNSHTDPADPAPDQLDNLIQKELHKIVLECFPKLEHEYRTVLTMRADGLKYAEIAVRLGVNENTVATWVSRGIKALAQCVRRRTETRLSRIARLGIPHD